jgi:hypothetical protein
LEEFSGRRNTPTISKNRTVNRQCQMNNTIVSGHFRRNWLIMGWGFLQDPTFPYRLGSYKRCLMENVGLLYLK